MQFFANIFERTVLTDLLRTSVANPGGEPGPPPLRNA